MDNNKVIIPLGDGFTLVAEKNLDSDYKEIFVYLWNEEENCCHQDLAVIGENYRYDTGLKVIPLHGEYSVKVYADPDSEDWQIGHCISRTVYPGEEVR